MWRRKVFRSYSLYISKDTKLWAFQTLVMPVLLCGAETWNMSKNDLWKLKTFQMRCLCDIIGVTLWSRMWNTTILEKAGELAVEDQLHQRRLQWFEDASPSSTEAICAVQTECKEETSRWSTSALV